jgi:cell division protein FtsB
MKKPWIIGGIALAVLLTFVLSDGFRQFIVRRRAIHRARIELRQTEAALAATRERLSRLQNDPAAYEQLVRQELGYLRPGEKEVRFLKK